jgi:prophage regulatory protein
MDDDTRLRGEVLRLPGVKRKTGLGTTSVYKLMKLGQFPKSISLGGRMVAWRVADIEAWLADPAGYRASDADTVAATAAAAIKEKVKLVAAEAKHARRLRRSVKRAASTADDAALAAK